MMNLDGTGNAPEMPLIPPSVTAYETFTGDALALLNATNDSTDMSRLAVPSQGLVDPTSTASSSYSSSTSSSAGTAATTPIVPTAQVLVAQLDAASAAAAAATVAGNATSAGGALAIAPKPDVSKTTPIAASKAPLHKPAEPNETVGTVYGAIYSGVPVYEMICRNVAMMRRRSDSYLNATQILKAAGIEKGRRTKILDKEIAQGQHEKIQGGYGKYQGTWIPFDRGVYLSQQFEIYELIKPLLDLEAYQPGKNDNTPTKEQHLAALKRANGEAPAEKKPTAQSAKKQAAMALALQQQQLQQQQQQQQQQQAPATAQVASDPHGMTRRPKRPYHAGNNDSRSETPSSPSSPDDDDDSDYISASNEKPTNHQKKKAKINEGNGFTTVVPTSAPPPTHRLDRHRAFLLAIFVEADNTNGDVNYIPESLNKNSLTPDIDIDLIIDDQGHTALHWAAALGRIGVLRVLLNRGANPRAVNYGGESALVRSVLVPNCYEFSCFDALLRLIGKATLLITDARQRTVLHHIALISAIKARSNCCKYYLDSIIEHVLPPPTPKSSLSSVATPPPIGPIVNLLPEVVMDEVVVKLTNEDPKYDERDWSRLLDAQDINGDTALNIAARIGNRVIVTSLLKAGADPKIPNLAGLLPTDFGMDDVFRNEDREILDSLTEKNKINPSLLKSSETNGKSLAGAPLTNISGEALGIEDVIGLEKKARDLTEVVTKMVNSLNENYSASLNEKHQKLTDAQVQLRDMSLELANLRAENEILRAEAKGVPELSGRLRYLFRRLHAASTSPLMSTLKKWASLGPNASNDEAMEALMDAADVSDVTEVLTSGNAELIEAKRNELKSMIEFVKDWQKLYEQDVQRLNQTLLVLDPPRFVVEVPEVILSSSSMEVDSGHSAPQVKDGNLGRFASKFAKVAKREILCRQIVAACCNLPLDAVDKILEPLLEMLEKDKTDTGIILGGVDVATLKANMRAAFANIEKGN